MSEMQLIRQAAYMGALSARLFEAALRTAENNHVNVGKGNQNHPTKVAKYEAWFEHKYFPWKYMPSAVTSDPQRCERVD